MRRREFIAGLGAAAHHCGDRPWMITTQELARVIARGFFVGYGPFNSQTVRKSQRHRAPTSRLAIFCLPRPLQCGRDSRYGRFVGQRKVG
jgi:hypothetical protein